MPVSSQRIGGGSAAGSTNHGVQLEPGSPFPSASSALATLMAAANGNA